MIFRASRQEKIKSKIIQVFPDINSEYLSEIIKYYNVEEGRQDVNRVVGRIIEKLLEMVDSFPRGNQKSPNTGKQPSSALVEALNKQLLLLFDMFPAILPATAREYCWQYSECIPYLVDKIVNATLSSRPAALGLFVHEQDLFRDPIYLDQVKRLLLNEFPFHWESTICAIMAESNSYYIECYEKLSEIKTSAVWTSLLPFTKRSWMEFKLDHPGLLREIEEMERGKLDEIAQGDGEIACRLNQEEYRKENQLITCKCCFGDYVFEEMGQCREGHLFCTACLSQTVKIGLFDSGNLRGKKLYCMSSESDCSAEIELLELQRLISKDLFVQYQGLLLEAAIKGSLDLVSCPACKYAEERPKISFLRRYAPKLIYVIKEYGLSVARIFAFAAIFYITLSSPLSATLLLLFHNHFIQRGTFKEAVLLYMRKNISLPIWARQVPTLPFNCRNPHCLKVTCSECGEDWISPHKCFEKQVDSLRLWVENAKSNALIRVCPSCSIRFSKIDGCNKMTCPNCKYEMCYVCRRDIGNQHYDHFCKHFRIVPGSDCTECKKCDLYQKERDEVAVAKAAAKAENEWKRMYPADVTATTVRL